MAKRLTEQFLRSIKPTGRRYTVADDGLQAEVHPTGRVSLYYKYRQGGKQTKEKLGEYSSDAFTLRMARDRVRELQAKLVADDLVRQSGLTLEQYIEGEFRRWCEQSRSSHRETMARLRARTSFHLVAKPVTPVVEFIAMARTISTRRFEHLPIRRWPKSTRRQDSLW